MTTTESPAAKTAKKPTPMKGMSPTKPKPVKLAPLPKEARKAVMGVVASIESEGWNRVRNLAWHFNRLRDRHSVPVAMEYIRETLGRCAVVFEDAPGRTKADMLGMLSEVIARG